MAVKRQVNIAFADSEPAFEPAEPQLAARGRVVIEATLLGALILAVFAICLRGTFIYMDDQTLTQNPALRTWWRGLASIWMHPTTLPHFQPLAFTVLWLEFKLFATRLPGGYLAINVLLHLVNVLMLWTLLRRLELRGALAAAAIFAVHPVNVEAVAWISQQGLLLSGMFCLAAVTVYLRYCRINPAPDGYALFQLPESSRVLYGMSIALLIGALASHPIAISVPCVIAVLIWWERGKLSRDDLRPLAPMLLLAMMWTAVVLYADARRAAAMNTELQIGVMERVLIGGHGLWIYLRHILFPVGLGFAYPDSSSTSSRLAGLVMIAVVLSVAWALRSRVGRGVFATMVLYVVGSVPGFVFRQPVDSFAALADFLIYLPAMVIVVAVVVAATEQFANRLLVARLVASIVVLGLGILSLQRIPDYRTPRNLWNAALRHDPGSAVAHNHLGLIELEQANDPVGAMRHFLKALERNPNDPRTLVNMAAVYNSTDETDKAIMRYHDALKTAPDDPDIHFGLALALARQGNSSGAVLEYERVLKARPDHLMAYNNLGLLRAERGEFEQAIECYNHAIRINPGFTIPYINLANLLFQQGKTQEAATVLEKVLRIDPENFGAYLNAGAMTAQLAQTSARNEDERQILLEQSERFLRAAVYLRPKLAEAHDRLGQTFFLRGKLSEAVHHFGRAVQLSPDDARFQQNLNAARQAQPQPK